MNNLLVIAIISTILLAIWILVKNSRNATWKRNASGPTIPIKQNTTPIEVIRDEKPTKRPASKKTSAKKSVAKKGSAKKLSTKN